MKEEPTGEVEYQFMEWLLLEQHVTSERYQSMSQKELNEYILQFARRQAESQ